MTPLAPLQAAAAALSMANSIKGLCEQTPSADELVNKITERIQQIVHTEFANDNIKKAIARFSTAVNFFQTDYKNYLDSNMSNADLLNLLDGNSAPRLNDLKESALLMYKWSNDTIRTQAQEAITLYLNLTVIILHMHKELANLDERTRKANLTTLISIAKESCTLAVPVLEKILESRIGVLSFKDEMSEQKDFRGNHGRAMAITDKWLSPNLEETAAFVTLPVDAQGAEGKISMAVAAAFTRQAYNYYIELLKTGEQSTYDNLNKLVCNTDAFAPDKIAWSTMYMTAAKNFGQWYTDQQGLINAIQDAKKVVEQMVQSMNAQPVQ